MKICENNEREVQGSEGLGDASRRKGKVERERRGESKGEYGPGLPMMEAEEEIEKRGRVLKEMGTNRLVVKKGSGCNGKWGRREQGESSPGAKDEDTIWAHDRHHKSELPMSHNGRVILIIEQRCCEEQRMQGGDGRESRNWVERRRRPQYSPRVDLAAHLLALAVRSHIAARTRGRYPIVLHSQPNPHSYGNSRDAPHVDSEGGST
jgi:hypothetical protein